MEKFARKCDITGEGMNEGWCWGDGLFYTKTKEDTLAELRKDYPQHKNLSDEDILSYYFEEGILYWTEWSEEDIEDQGYYFIKNGKKVVG